MGISEPNGVLLGFDPGGKGRFGWSVCTTTAGDLQPSPTTGLADDAWDALIQVRDALGYGGFDPPSSVLAAGIDAPMFWSGRGNRMVDDILRRRLKESGYPPSKLGGTVQQVNSLRGACVVQGTLLGRYLHETWELPLTEAHPRVLRYLLCVSEQPNQVEMVRRLTEGLVDHQMDATLAAVAAWAMIHKPPGWQNLYDQECSPVHPFDVPVGYWMPDP